MNKKLLVGVSRYEITPPFGSDNKQYSIDDLIKKHIESPLYVNASVIDDGAKQVVFVSVDICVIYVNIIKEIIQDISKITSISEDAIFIHATHTHAYQHLDKNKGDIYTPYFCKQVVTAVIQAYRNKRPVGKVSVGKGSNSEVVFNRRLKRPDGRILMNFMYDETAAQCDMNGITDPELFVVRFDDKEGKPLCIIWNFGNHNNIMYNMISSDQSGHVNEKLIETFGRQLVPIFMFGPCGNVNWIDASKPWEKDEDCYLKLERYSQSIFNTIINIMCDMKVTEVNKIIFYTEEFTLQIREQNEYDSVNDETFGSAISTKDFLCEDLIEENPFTRKQEPISYKVSAVSLGKDIAITTGPAEYFCEIGMEVKKTSPFKYTLVSTLTNGWVGYVPMQYAWDEGGYEPRAAWLERGTAEWVIEQHKRLIRKCYEII